jgi:glutamate/tyrosine decarboxylase-like PLP-dependent enzyme
LAYLDAVPEKPVVVPNNDPELHQVMGGPLSVGGSAPEAVLERLVRGGDLGTVPSSSSRYFGYVVGGALPVALAADWLATAWDQCGALYDLSPLISILEEICRGWLVNLFQLPRQTQIAFTPACTYANLTCLSAARHAVLARHGWDVESRGLDGAPQVTVLMSETIHASVPRSLRVLGLGNVRTLSTDASGRIDISQYEDELNRVPDGPLIVCGQVGEVNTGIVDPLRRLSALAHERGGWVHLDGAFGLWAAATDRRYGLLDGLELADSWATDAHKWLNVPYDCGMAFVADGDVQHDALKISPDYLHQENTEQRHAVGIGLHFSTRSRVIPVWAVLAQLGSDGVKEMIDRHCALARMLAALLAEEPYVEVLNEVSLNQVAVRFHRPDRDSDTHTMQVSAAFQQAGVAWASTSRWRGDAILRLSVINWATTEEDITQAATSLLDCHRHLIAS